MKSSRADEESNNCRINLLLNVANYEAKLYFNLDVIS